jgi:cytosine/adenosine deaminase-related metal-dependent hydrolase
VVKAYQHGLAPSLSIDVVTTVPGDMFTQMRAAFGAERVRINADAWQADVPIPDWTPTARQMLEMATINGARLAGFDGRVGSLAPGKQADIVLIDATAINVAPLIDPVAAVVLSADVSNVETVIVGGVVRKRDGRLVADVARARNLAESSRDYLVSATGFKTK